MSVITFVVKGSEQVYKFSKVERGFTYGSPIGDNGVARKGRPSKFESDTVITSEPVNESSTNKVSKPVTTSFLNPVSVDSKETVEKVNQVESNPVLVPAGGGNHVETERLTSDNFLKLD